ncbi:hypothetical protein [Burkholderia vietnamiensis]|uniref:hypothetical protein n=1 Tax=Burkholderia vietnamiensis TaxID=60552 RepID=UPI00158F0128|nr:hypothetical protein [Burkholderia vietnamiensis]
MFAARDRAAIDFTKGNRPSAKCGYRSHRLLCNNKIRILGWEGWIQSPDGRVGHGNAPQGTTSLEDLSIPEAADFCRRTIAAAALEWTENNLGTTDRLHFCITVEANDAATNS